MSVYCYCYTIHVHSNASESRFVENSFSEALFLQWMGFIINGVSGRPAMSHVEVVIHIDHVTVWKHTMTESRVQSRGIVRNGRTVASSHAPVSRWGR